MKKRSLVPHYQCTKCGYQWRQNNNACPKCGHKWMKWTNYEKTFGRLLTTELYDMGGYCSGCGQEEHCRCK